MTRHLQTTTEYRGYEIDTIHYDDGRVEYGVVSDRVTVEREGYLDVLPTPAEAQNRIDEIHATPRPDISVDALLRGL